MTTMQHLSPTEPACTRFEERLAAYLEDDLDAVERDEMDRHRVACARCAQVVLDIKSLVTAAAQLPSVTPTRDLWAGISDRIAAPTVALFPGASTPALPVRRGVSMRLFAIAATMLIAVSSAITWRIARAPSTGAGAVGTLASTDSGVDTNGKMLLATNPDVVYEQEIVALRIIVNERFTELDSTTVAVLKRNLDIIDRAIEESRQALALDPTSRALSISLDRAVESKLALMRRVALL